jgi:hypothetical protein
MKKPNKRSAFLLPEFSRCPRQVPLPESYAATRWRSV